MPTDGRLENVSFGHYLGMKKIFLLVVCFSVIFAIHSPCLAQDVVTPGWYSIPPNPLLTNGWLGFFQSVAVRDPYRFTAALSGSREVPPNNSAGHGTGSFVLTNRTFEFGIVAFMENFPTRAFIHGPAGPDNKAPIIFDLGEPGLEGGQGFVWFGTLTLARSQVAQLISGQWYVNITSAAYPEGEIRGQIVPVGIIMDTDADGVPDGEDLCPSTDAGAIVDDAGCSIEQLCPCNDPWRNQAEYFKCVRRTSACFLADGLITQRERYSIFRDALRSNCGRGRAR